MGFDPLFFLPFFADCIVSAITASLAVVVGGSWVSR
jgi:hypothetical protein